MQLLGQNTKAGSATLTSISTATAVAGLKFSVAASCIGASNVDSNASMGLLGSGVCTTTTSLTASPVITRSTPALISSFSTLTSQGWVNALAGATPAATATITPNSYVLTQAVAGLFGATDLTAEAEARLNALSLLQSSSTLSPVGQAYYAASAPLTSLATIQGNPGLLFYTTASLQSESNIQGVGQNLIYGYASAVSESTVYPVGFINTGSAAWLRAACETSGYSSVLLKSTAALGADAQLDGQGAVLAQSSAVLDSSSNVSAWSYVTYAPAAQLVSNASLNSVSFITTASQAELSSNSVLNLSPQVILSGNIGIISNAWVTANEVLFRCTPAMLESSSVLTGTLSKHLYFVRVEENVQCEPKGILDQYETALNNLDQLLNTPVEPSGSPELVEVKTVVEHSKANKAADKLERLRGIVPEANGQSGIMQKTLTVEHINRLAEVQAKLDQLKG